MSVEIVAVVGLPEIEPGAELGGLMAGAAARQGEAIGAEDVVVISQKVVSKAEGRVRALGQVQAGERAEELAPRLGKDPRFVQLVLDESRSVLRAERGVLITETREGWICANAGIDASNVAGADSVALLPEDSDASARRIRGEIRTVTGTGPGVVIADSFGRAWRMGQADVAIGCAGVRALDDWRGRLDTEGRELTATLVAVADQVAAAADLVRSKTSATPVALVRGLGAHVTADDGPGAAPLRRAKADDLFR
jgi:coenzyme F420-0:L-glutamate ligase/coenzyme F420-1:gamma-L-glutamate ligase